MCSNFSICSYCQKAQDKNLRVSPSGNPYSVAHCPKPVRYYLTLTFLCTGAKRGIAALPNVTPTEVNGAFVLNNV